MSRRHNSADEFDNLAAERGREDGGDPKEFHAKPRGGAKRAGRKAKQLCAQAREALDGALAACGDPVAQAARVLSVQPAPHTGRLLVVLGAPADVSAAAVAAGVGRAARHLRAEVARAISRRYAPELTFEVIEV